MSYLTAQAAKREKATVEAEQFRALLWDMAHGLNPGETLTVGHADWYGPAQTHTWAEFQRAAGEREPAIRVDLEHVGPNPVVMVGVRYQRDRRMRQGLKKMTAAMALGLARAYADEECQRQQAEREARQRTQDTKAEAEAILGFKTHNGFPLELRTASGFESCVPGRLVDGTLVVHIKVERRLTLPEAQRLRAVLQTMGGQ